MLLGDEHPAPHVFLEWIHPGESMGFDPSPLDIETFIDPNLEVTGWFEGNSL